MKFTGVMSMKVFSLFRQSVEKRRTRILEKLREGSQNLTDLRRYFKGCVNDELIKHDLRNFQKMGVVKTVKFKGYERVYYYVK